MKPLRAGLYVAAAFVLVASLPPLSAQGQSNDVPPGATVTYHAYEETWDGLPTPPSQPEYYKVDIGHYSPPQPGKLQPNKPAPPLPGIPDGPDPAFVQDCTQNNKDAANTSVGWTKNHYMWCKIATEFWQKEIVQDGKRTVVAKLSFGAIWTGYADPANRRFVTFVEVLTPQIIFGSFSPQTRFVIDTTCKGGGQASCTSKDNPVDQTLEQLQAQDTTVIRTDITDTSPSNFPLSGDKVANLDIISGWEGFPAGDGEPVIFNNDPVHSRCDSASSGYRTKQACIFNNVSPWLNYDKADTAFPIDEIVDHIKYAQDTLGAPGKFDGGKPVGPPLTRNRNAAKKQANYNASKAACKVANGGQPWNWRKVQCDEYPFQSTNQGATNTSTPSSARLLNARQNLEGGIQLQNWYAWDRILDGDQFWVHVQ